MSDASIGINLIIAYQLSNGMNADLADKVILITGSGQGIGQGLVHGFLNRAAVVVAGVRSMESRNRLPAGAMVLRMDVSDEGQVKEAVAEVLKVHGRIDVLINNAGIHPRSAPQDISVSEWEKVINVNLHGAWRCCQAVIEPMIAKKAGVILNVGSMAHRVALADSVHYHATKAGMEGLTRGLARDLGPYGIRVNCLRIGAVEVPREAELGSPKEILDFVNERQCIPGRLTPESIMPVFAFFASDGSADLTGQCITVDRGWSLS